jgi:hypothetical protein
MFYSILMLSTCVTFIPLKSDASYLCNQWGMWPSVPATKQRTMTYRAYRILAEQASSDIDGPCHFYLHSASIWWNITGHSLFHSGFSRLLHSMLTMNEILYWNKITGVSFPVLCRVPSSSDLIRYSVNTKVVVKTNTTVAQPNVESRSYQNPPSNCSWITTTLSPPRPRKYRRDIQLDVLLPSVARA